jgi:MFS family permease
MTSEQKSTLKLVFLTLFLDLMGFSIIFPLFPELAEYYWKNDPDNIFLQQIFNFINTFGRNPDSFQAIVLFGGILGALYSLLQFIASPFWGSLSDRYGRRPILLISLAGIALSYVLWFFSGSFSLLLLSRVVSGFMSGNLSTASAVVSDITDQKNRSRGMATIGIAFALGFILGPAIGGLMSLIDLTQLTPSLVSLGVNPFSSAALFAFVLTLINLVLMFFKFKETNSNHNQVTERSANIFRIFKPLPYANVNKVNVSYFIYLLAFSGMEFTLTFLAAERLNYSSWDNAKMFIFIGLIIAFVQGGYVRRKAHIVGEKKMAMQGFVAVIIGLLIIAISKSSAVLFTGLFFLSTGSSMVIPTLTSLVSQFTPSHEQGRSLGIFRSLGSLSRVFGPLFACVLYWQHGSATPYYLAAVAIIGSILILVNLAKPNEGDATA